MITIQQTSTFANWLDSLKDTAGQRIIGKRLAMVEAGHFGSTKMLGDGVSELRIAYGPGYRVYYTRRGETVILLLVGGDKGTQSRDIRHAKEIAAGLD